MQTCWHTMPRKKNESTLLHTFVLNKFLTANSLFRIKCFWKSSCRSCKLTSSRFFRHLLRPNWSIFGRIRNRRHFPSKTATLPFSNIFQRFTVPRIIDQFGRKRCQKKRKDVNYQLLRTVGRQKLVQYILTWYLGCFILVGSAFLQLLIWNWKCFAKGALDGPKFIHYKKLKLKECLKCLF